MANLSDFELRRKGPAAASPLAPKDTKEAAREALRAADAGYRALASKAGELLATVEQGRPVNREVMMALAHDILELHSSTEASLLFENLQLVRLDDSYYPYHAVNVALLNVIIGEAMGIYGDELTDLVCIGLVIDLGMLLLPHSIRTGTGQFTESERAQMRNHVNVSAENLQRVGIAEPAILNALLYHHERFNGQGYPKGLSGEDIPLQARITAVSDTYDAASARKAYRRNKSPFEVLAELAANENATLDPGIARIAATTLAEMLIGRRVILSDRSVGKVVDVRSDNLAYPQVIVVGKRIQTSPSLYPVSLSSYVPMF